MVLPLPWSQCHLYPGWPHGHHSHWVGSLCPHIAKSWFELKMNTGQFWDPEQDLRQDLNLTFPLGRGRLPHHQFPSFGLPVYKIWTKIRAAKCYCTMRQEKIPPLSWRFYYNHRDIQWLNHMLEVATVKFKPGNITLEARVFTVAIHELVSWSALNPI